MNNGHGPEEPADQPSLETPTSQPEPNDLPAQLMGMAITGAPTPAKGLLLGLVLFEHDPDFWSEMVKRWTASYPEDQLQAWRQRITQQSDNWKQWLTRADALPPAPAPITLLADQETPAE